MSEREFAERFGVVDRRYLECHLFAFDPTFIFYGAALRGFSNPSGTRSLRRVGASQIESASIV